MSEVKVNKISPRSGTAVTLGDSGDKFTVPSGSNITINSGASITNDGTATGFDTDTNDKVKVSTNDTTPGFLNGKLVAGTNITLTEGSDGGDETLTAALSGTIPTARLGTGTANSTTFLRGDQTYASATPADGSITTAQLAYNPNPFRNIVINGDMSLAQRATSVTGLTGAGYNTVDRYRLGGSVPGTWTQSQATDVPTGQGFATSFKMDCTTAASQASGDSMYIQSKYEGQNLQYLKKGTSSAESTTLSFWVKSNKTGTYIAMLLDNDNTRTISKAYTISNANTWEKKSVTFAGDTSGALANDNGPSLEIYFWLSAGSDSSSGTLQTSWGSKVVANQAVGQVNLADSTSNEWYVTGVQLEAGTTASDFEFLPADVNLQRCQRYFEKVNTYEGVVMNIYSATAAYGARYFITNKRATPSVTIIGTNILYSAGSPYSGTLYANNIYIDSVNFLFNGSSMPSGNAGHVNNTSSGAKTLEYNSEL